MLIIPTAFLRSTTILRRLLLLLFLHISINLSVVSTMMDHTTTTTITITKENSNNNNLYRHVLLPDRSILEDILFQYYGNTNHDTYYQQHQTTSTSTTDHEEICRVRFFHSFFVSFLVKRHVPIVRSLLERERRIIPNCTL